jgi:hypothetical protein
VPTKDQAKVPATCARCSAAFKTWQHKIDAGEGRYCSLLCARRSQGEQSRKPARDRFWKRIDKDGPLLPHVETPCWIWTGARTRRGYGLLGERSALVYAHRLSYEIHHGEVGSLFVCHRCDNPSCVNPAHLFLGTALDNVHDMLAKGRGAHQCGS